MTLSAPNATTPDDGAAPAAPRRFMLSNSRCACAPVFCQTAELGGAKCEGYCVRCGSDMAIKAAGGPPTR